MYMHTYHKTYKYNLLSLFNVACMYVSREDNSVKNKSDLS